MLVLHAFWSPESGPAIWAEDSELTLTSRSQALRRARPHPFAAPIQTLGALVEGTPSTSEILLPSTRRSPVDSPEIVRITPRSPAASTPSLLAWTVPAILLDPATVGTTLARLTDPDHPGDATIADARAAASVRYLAELAGYADELARRGRVLPTLRQHDHGFDARWRAVLTGPDAVAAQDLVARMPPALRAVNATRGPAALATDALDTMVDARVRQRLATPFLPRRRGRRPARPAVTEAWLDALAGPDAHIDADPDELALLQEQLRPWTASAEGAPGPARLVLRLSDPGTNENSSDDDRAGWQVDFLLRSNADPSLLIHAARAWDDDGALGRWLERPREVLLAELARAQRVYPGLERGLRTARPTGMALDAAAAHRFLTAEATALDQAGVEVLLPAWWTRSPRMGLRLAATPSDKNATAGTFGKEHLCDFRWELAVGEHGLGEEEIAALVAAKAPLVQLRGEWVAIDQARLQRALEFLQREGAGQKSVGEILTLALSHPDDLDLPLEITDVTAGGWLGDLLGGAAADSITAIKPPADFAATLRPYQSRGLGWLDFLGRLGLGACLADDMGLGKTVQLLALEATRRAAQAPARAEAEGSEGTASRPTLLLCPMSLLGNWEAEAARFAPRLRVLVYHGADRPKGTALADALAATDLVVTTYATALGDIEDLVALEWDRLVLDEAQAVKNRLSRTAKAVRRLQAGQRIALTGTPVENRLSELWSIMDFLNPGMLGSPELFRARFATPIEQHGDDDAARMLRRITRPYILRRVKTDPAVIDDLPEKMEIKQHYRLTVEQASLYQSVVEEMMQRIEDSEGIERRGNVLAAMTKLKQICNHPAQLLHDRSPIARRSGKIIRLEEILDEVLAEGDRVLCFTQFTEFAEMLVPHLAARFDTDVAYLSGSTSRQRRTELVERFQAGAGAPIFVLSLKAGGTGLNLTAANHVVHLDRWWNPAVENQATDRAFRIGQKRRVQVRKFVGTGTLEERIDALIDEKKALADLVVGDGESWLTELSTARLRDLFTLSKEAIGE